MQTADRATNCRPPIQRPGFTGCINLNLLNDTKNWVSVKPRTGHETDLLCARKAKELTTVLK